MTNTISELFESYQLNILYPEMVQELAVDLGVAPNTIYQLGVGFKPDTASWVFPERDARGNVIGLLFRSANGFKFTEKGSTRGLIYRLNPNFKQTKEPVYEWVRLYEANVECPICGKPDWCLVSSDDPSDPSAVLCTRISDGATKILGPNKFLHIRDPERQKQSGHQTVLPDTDKPILIVEGATDVLAGMDLGFVTIGRPTAEGGMDLLQGMPLAGKELWIIGENDDGAGKKGMEDTFLNLTKLSDNIHRLMPPKGIKDLRAWVQSGLIAENLFAAIGEHGQSHKILGEDIFEDDSGIYIAGKFRKEYPNLCSFNKQWLTWIKGRYEILSPEFLRGAIYRFVDGKKYVRETKTGVETAVYKPSARKISDIIDALYTWCIVNEDPPCWLENEKGYPEPKNLIIFQNGILNVEDYIRGKITIYEPTPNLFALHSFPYEFNPDLKSDLWLNFLDEIFSGDKATVELIQQWFGYNSVPDMSFEKLMLFTGRPRSGKGTILEAMSAMLGRDQCVSTDFQALANPFGRAPLVGKLAAILGDAKTPKSSEADAALETILRIVGRDPIQINPKHIPQFTTYLTARFTVAMNDLPEFTDHARALESRLLPVYFPNSYVGREDPSLKERLRYEAQQGKLINFALEGLKHLKQQGYFTMPGASHVLLSQFRESASPITEFVNECCASGGNNRVLKDQIYEAWQKWCNENGHKPDNKARFGRRLLQTCPGIQHQRMTSEGRPYEYVGIGLYDWVQVKYLGRP